MLPGWVPGALGIAAFVHLLQFAVCGHELVATGDNPLTVISNLVVFQGCEGTSPLLSFLLFCVVSLPLILLVAVIVSQMTVTGGVTALVTGAVLAVVGFFT